MFKRKAIHKEGTWGLGFKDQEIFNLAMLTKQAWNLLVKPSSLYAKILKILYYPHVS